MGRNEHTCAWRAAAVVSAVAATAVLALAAAPLSSSGLHAQEAADTTITMRTTGSNNMMVATFRSLK